MAEKPTYEELAQRVKELEAEKLHAQLEKKSSTKSSQWLAGHIHAKAPLEAATTNIDLGSIINVDEIQSIMDDFFSLTGMVTAILDLNGKVIEATGWQDICTKFHRVNPLTANNCTESDLFLAKNLKAGEFVSYKCKNGLSDVVTPLYIGNIHLGNIFTGQFFYDDDADVQEERFIKQAEKYDFDKISYLDAFRRIPRYSHDTIDNLMNFLVKFATYISRVSFSNLQLEQEIQERKKAESAQKESAAMLRSLIRAIPDLVWLKDPQGIYLFCNSRFESFFGAAEIDIIGKTDYDFLEKDLADFFRKHDKLAMESAKPIKNEEEIVFASDGHNEILETIKTPLYHSDGKLAGVLGIGRDITERRQAEEERETLSAQLQQSQKMEAIGILAGGVAHDFNNMLGVILGHSELAMDKVDPSGQLYEDLNQIHQAAERSADITRQLLSFARKQAVAPKILDLNTTIEGMLKMLQRLIGEDIHLIWLPSSELWLIKIDPSQVDQMLANLCINARTAITGVGTITVETKNTTIDEQYTASHMDAIPGEYVRISVSDTGDGMDKTTLARIFEPFFTTKELGEGTGLGLATVFGVVKQNNGFLNVYSEPGKGSSFNIYLPRDLGSNDQKKSASVLDEIEHGHETILLVEDESAILRMTTMMLQQLGYSVLPSGSPNDAIRRISECGIKIDMVLTDVIMPGMNGQDLVQHLQTIQPDIKHLFMSGYTANVISHHKVLEDGLLFIQKPFSRRELASKVRQALDNAQFSSGRN
jgi:PAS domain S-box-containing protein